jgi:hypothetical protein
MTDQDDTRPDLHTSRPIKSKKKQHGSRRPPADGQEDAERSSDESAETQAIVLVERAIRRLKGASRKRVLGWFDRSPSADGAQLERKFEDLSALFEAARPSSDVERALTACYFRNNVLGEADVTAHALAQDLTEIGHRLGRISSSLTSLNMRTPSYVLIISKSKGQHKRYRITSAGTKHVEEMIAGPDQT